LNNMSSIDVLKNVFDNSEADVPAREIPKDISLREEKKSLRHQQQQQRLQDAAVASSGKGDGDVTSLYSPNHFPDALYSPTHFQEEARLENEPKDDGILSEEKPPAQSPTKATKTRKTKKWTKRTPSEIFSNMYGHLATCATVMVVPPRGSSGKAENDRMWDLYPAETIEHEEAEQIHRLTSWNTIETALSTVTAETAASFGTLDIMQQNQPTQQEDLNRNDQGRDESISEKSKERKRTVKFDYPIISSLRECPRPDPRDLPNLYFTEEELGQIEDDRESTYTADDVEVVCVSTGEGEDPARKRATNGPEGESTDSDRQSSPKGPSKKDDSRKRYIKSVQIYLRERSRERAPKS